MANPQITNITVAGSTYDILDPNAMPIAGGTFTGSVNAPDLTVGDLLVNGDANFTNGVKSYGSPVLTSVSATTTSITPVTKKTVIVSGTSTSIKIVPTTVTTVVIGGTSTSITPVTKKTVVTACTPAVSSISNGVLTLTNGSKETGDSVTEGIAIKPYTALTTVATSSQNVYTGLSSGDSVTNGTAVTVVTGVTGASS